MAIDRETVYTGAIASALDILNNAQMAMIGLGFLAQDLLGTNTWVYGAAVTQYESELVVSVAPGRIYQVADIDATAWSSLPINANTIVQQGISWTPTLFSTAAPVTSGDSINYLIEAQFLQVDGDPAVISYYNSQNPSQPFSGAGNNGVAQNRIRYGQLALQCLTGTPAATGTQTTPATTSGWVPLVVVTVAYGASTPTITIPQGSAYAQPNQSGSFTMTCVGITGSPTGTCYYRTNGSLCTLVVPTFTGTSDSTLFQLSGLPASLQPTIFAGSPTFQLFPMTFVENDGAYISSAHASIESGSGTISLGFAGNYAGWSSSGTKTVAGNLSYLLF